MVYIETRSISRNHLVVASGIRVRIKPNHKPITQFKKVRACQSPNRREYNESNRNGLYSEKIYSHRIPAVNGNLTLTITWRSLTIRYRHMIHYGSIITWVTRCKVAKILILIILLADGLFFGHLSLMIKTWTERRRNSSTYNEQEFIENPKNGHPKIHPLQIIQAR